jgi:diacylglycerol diphosphate phosphatase/phosphatidate phosphatase
VPVWLLAILAGVVPLLAVILLSFGSRRKLAGDTHHALLALVLSLLVTGFLTEWVKVTVGRLRPDFLSRCDPVVPSNLPLTTGGSSLWLGGACRGSERLVMDGRKSFPSGHSSLSFAGLGFISLYLIGQWRLMAVQDGASASPWSWMVVSGPLATALFVAMSRIVDYRHHWQDVTVGSLLGIIVTFLIYRLYYGRLDVYETSGRPKLRGGRRLWGSIIEADKMSRESSPEDGEHTEMRSVSSQANQSGDFCIKVDGTTTV